MRASGVVLAALIVASCGGSDGWSGSESDSAGVRIVTSEADDQASLASTLSVQEVLKIGQPADPNYMFGSITGLDVSESGEIYVLDGQSQTVRVFDAAGQFVRSFGRAGSGPGELSQGAQGLVVLHGDTVLVPDMGQQRLSVYMGNGTPLESVPMSLSNGIPARWVGMNDGTVIVQVRLLPIPQIMTNITEPADYLLRRNARGETLDTLLKLPAGQTVQFGASGMTMRLFESEPMWAMGDDGAVYYGMNSEYSIGEYNSDGQLKRIIRRSVEPREVTEEDKAAVLGAMRQLISGRGGTPEMLDQILGMMQFADHYPLFASLMGGPDGSLWVRRVRSSSELASLETAQDLQRLGSTNWDVYGGDGRFRGQVVLPQDFNPMVRKGDMLYGIWLDDLEVQHVMAVRVLGEGAAAAG